jgi:hypothetical protein
MKKERTLEYGDEKETKYKKNRNRKYLPNYCVLLRTKGSKKKNEKLVIKQGKKTK